MIEITGVDLIAFVKAVYNLSKPQGFGFFHYNTDPLTNEEAKMCILDNNPRIAVSMDYVNGRACKMTVFKKDDGLFIYDDWYDHTDDQFEQLLNTFGIKRQHGITS